MWARPKMAKLYRSLKVGCNGFLTKPISKKIIVQIDRELQELIPGFLENRQKEVCDLQGYLEQKNYEQIRILGHSMKGFGSGYGFEFITTIGQAFEESAKKQDSESIGKMIREYAMYLNQIEVVFPS
jgi:hypothetical protein